MAKLKVTKNELTGPQVGYEPIYGVGLWADAGSFPATGYNKPAEYGVMVDPTQFYKSWEYKLFLMRNDPTIALLRQLWIAPILSAGWSVEAQDDVPDNVVEFATEEMDRIHEDIIPQAGLGCLDWGWAPFEKVYTLRSDGLLGIGKLKSLLQQMTIILSNERTGEFEGLSQADTWQDNGQMMSIDQSAPSPMMPVLDLDHALLFNFDVIGTNWYGQAPMRAAEGPFDASVQVDSTKAKLNLRIAGEHWVIYYPVGVTEQPDGSTLDNSVLAGKIMEQMLNNGSATLPNEIRSELNILNGDAGSDEYQSWRIELLSANSDATGNYYIEQNRYNDNLKARALGFPERAVFEGQFGTKAEAEVHADLAVQGLEKRSQQLTQCVSLQVLKPLIEFNFGAEWAEKVCLVANPIVDSTMQLWLKLYEAFLRNPDVLIEEFDNINMREVRDKLRIPQFEEGQENPDSLRDQIDERAPDMTQLTAPDAEQTDEDENETDDQDS